MVMLTDVLRLTRAMAGRTLWRFLAGVFAASWTAPAALAATSAGTVIEAQAQLVYQGSAGTVQTSSFVVDRLIQFTWTPASPGATDTNGWPDPANDTGAVSFGSLDAEQTLSFNLTNTGNETAAYRFFVLSNQDTVTSNAPPGQIDFVGETGATVHVTPEGAAGDDVTLSTDFDAAHVDGFKSADVPPGESLTVEATITLPDTATYDSYGVFALAAQAVQPGEFQVTGSGTPSAGAPFQISSENTLAVADVIFTDGDGDGDSAGAPLANAFSDMAGNGVSVSFTSLKVVPVTFGFARAISGLDTDATDPDCADLTVALPAFETGSDTDYFVPGACIEQTVTLSLGSAGITIEDISVSEAFPRTLTLLNAGLTGLEVVNAGLGPAQTTLLAAASAAAGEPTSSFDLGTSYTLRSGTMTESCPLELADPCTIDIEGMSLEGPSDGGLAATTGVIRLRHRVN